MINKGGRIEVFPSQFAILFIKLFLIDDLKNPQSIKKLLYLTPQKYFIWYSSIKCSYNKAEANFEMKNFRLKHSNTQFFKCQLNTFQLVLGSPCTPTYMKTHVFSCNNFRDVTVFQKIYWSVSIKGNLKKLFTQM